MSISDPAALKAVDEKLRMPAPRNAEVEALDEVRASIPGGLLHRLSYNPVVPGSLRVRVCLQGVTLHIRDDGRCALSGDLGAPGGGITNSLEYLHGQLSLRLPENIERTERDEVSVEIRYRYRKDLRGTYA